MKKTKQFPMSSGVSVEPRMLTIPQAATYLGARPFFVRSLCSEFRKGGTGLPHLIFGKRIVIDKADLDKFVENQKVAA